MIKCVIVDDDSVSIKALSLILQKFFKNKVEITGTATTIEKAVELISQNEVDLVFLDVQMKGETGFDLFKHFKTPDFKVIFITSFEKYAIEAIRCSAIDYILKPINFIEIKDALNRYELIKNSDFGLNYQTLIENLHHDEDLDRKMLLPVGDQYELVSFSKILYCEADGNYTNIILLNGKHIMVLKGMKEIEEYLSDDRFFRTHKSTIINLDHVKSVDKKLSKIKLVNGEVIDLAVRRKDDFLAIFPRI